jgi:NAD(P)-dependent dehydrogenase (short-subunit alcohol dehydrogenase family)
MSGLSAAYAGLHTLYSNFFVSLPQPKPNGDMSKQVYIVTGANTGLGYELSKHLLANGTGHLIMAVRDPAKGEAAKASLLKSTNKATATVEVWPLDVDSPSSVKAFSDRASGLPRLDGVCANAGVMTSTFTRVASHERTLTINVIHTFLLFFHLLPKMRAHQALTGKPTVFSIPNSALYLTSKITELAPPKAIFSRLDDPAKADMPNRYPLSKLLVLWLVRELSERGASDQAFPIVTTPNPSFCKSGLLREDQSAAARLGTKYVARSTEEGSRALYHGLVNVGQAEQGTYLANCKVQT